MRLIAIICLTVLFLSPAAFAQNPGGTTGNAAAKPASENAMATSTGTKKDDMEKQWTTHPAASDSSNAAGSAHEQSGETGGK